jgi:hypothetical protein
MTQSLATIAYACQLLQASHGRIESAITELGITPATIINGKRHYSEDDLDRVRRHLASQLSAGGPLQHRAAGIS